jgi:hypothetical protein
MGAEYQQLTIDGEKTRNEVKALFELAQEDDRYENGHSYSGGFGMADGLQFDDKTFTGDAAASEYLQDACKKWECARCVTFVNELTGKSFWMIGAWCSS